MDVFLWGQKVWKIISWEKKKVFALAIKLWSVEYKQYAEDSGERGLLSSGTYFFAQ